jgi:hypothetical protein
LLAVCNITGEDGKDDYLVEFENATDYAMALTLSGEKLTGKVIRNFGLRPIYM